MNQHKHFLIYLSLITFFVVVSGIVLRYFVPDWINAYLWYEIVYMILLTSITYIVAMKGMKKDFYSFQNYYMGMMAVRLLVTGGFIFLYFYSVEEKKDAYSFLINFFVVYITYTFFEVLFLVKQINQSDSKQK